MAATATIGTFISTATVAIASVCGAPDVPIRKSTFSCSTSLRALRVDAAGYDPSSSWMTRTFRPAALADRARAGGEPFGFGHADRRHRPAEAGDEADQDVRACRHHRA